MRSSLCSEGAAPSSPIDANFLMWFFNSVLRLNLQKELRFLFDDGPQKRQKWEAVKLKDLFPAFCLVLLIISEIFLFSANRQKNAALAHWREAQQQVADLQQQLVEITNSIAANMSADVVRLRADNSDLPRLRSRVQQLQADNSKLVKELSAAREAAGQREEQLNEMQAQTEQAAEDQAAQAQEIAQIAAQQKASCIANLRLIYLAKQAWALEKNKTDTDVPTEQDILPYLKGGVFPVCPSGGVYTIGAVGQLPTCSIPGHVLPPQP